MNYQQGLFRKKQVEIKLWFACVWRYFSESKNKCYKQTNSDKRKSIDTESKTIEVMEFWKRNFDKLKSRALSQKQTILAANNQRCIPGDTKVFHKQRSKSNKKTTTTKNKLATIKDACKKRRNVTQTKVKKKCVHGDTKCFSTKKAKSKQNFFFWWKVVTVSMCKHQKKFDQTKNSLLENQKHLLSLLSWSSSWSAPLGNNSQSLISAFKQTVFTKKQSIFDVRNQRSKCLPKQ